VTLRPSMILDANVLIDFIKADRIILKRIVEDVGPLCVASVIVHEVKDIKNEDDLFELGLHIIEIEIEDAYTAGTWTGSTSFQDNICLLTAKRHGCICVTNDKSLRKLCEHKGVRILWGLELLAKLYNVGGISKKKAINVAESIHQLNPYHINTTILQRFKESL